MPAIGVGRAATLMNSDVELVLAGGAEALGVADGVTTGSAVVGAAGGVWRGADGARPEGAGAEGAASELGMGS